VGVFKSERRIFVELSDLEPVANHLVEHFRVKGYEVTAQQSTAGAWDIDITRTGEFRAISGLRTALKVRLEPEPGSVLVRAGVGILGQQAAASMLSVFVFPPLIYAQIWGAVQSAKIDNEALAVVEEAAAGLRAGSASAGAIGVGGGRGGFCGECGTARTGGRFCTGCGAALAVG
jgi:hypothetical protein